jgi:hypothetical protein
LIDLTKTKIEMVSQWGIGHKGKGAVFFKQLANGKKILPGLLNKSERVSE